MKVYTYRGLSKLGIIYLQIGGVLAIAFGTSVALGFGWLASQYPQGVQPAICVGSWSILLGWLIGLVMVNAFPTISITDENLTISAFFFKHIPIPWSDVIDVRPAGILPFGKILVRARRITPFHRIIGWQYSHSLYPGFLIGPDIEDRDELVREIRRRIPSRP